MTDTVQTALPTVFDLTRQGIERGWHHGVQIYVSLAGRTVVDEGIGASRPADEMTADTLTAWFSAGKPLTAILAARFSEWGRLDIDRPVADWIPEFAGGGKEDITVRQLLTHTAGLPNVELDWPKADWTEIIRDICDLELTEEASSEPMAAYSPAANWFLLGEILCRIDGRLFAVLFREALCQPLGLNDTWCGMSDAVFTAHSDRIGAVFIRTGDSLKMTEHHIQQFTTAPSPGGNCRGTARDLGRFYEVLLSGGVVNGEAFVRAETIAEWTRPHRVGKFDETFQHQVDFGLGFIVDSNRYGADTVPYGFGRHCTPRTFGHGGVQSSIGFADPEHQLVAVVIANGLPGEPKHQRRARAINEAIYQDLGLATAS